MSPPNPAYLLGEIRALTEQYKAGRNPESFQSFRKLIDLLLHTTVLDPTASISLVAGPRRDEVVRVIEGRNGEALKLNDGRYLRLSMTLFLEHTDKGPRVKVKSSSFQYQMEKEGETDSWVFRYDYLREPPDPHPYAHVHVKGTLTAACLGPNQKLEDIHFPTERTSIEAIIRLLIEQFRVPPYQPADIWRAALAESETAFKEIAHRSVSGPSR